MVWEGRRADRQPRLAKARLWYVLTPGFEGRMGSPLPFRSGPDDPGGGGIAVLRGRLPRQQAASPEARHASSGLAQSRPSKTLAVSFPGPQTPNPRGKRRQSWLPGSRIIRDAKVGCPEAALSGRERATAPP